MVWLILVCGCVCVRELLASMQSVHRNYRCVVFNMMYSAYWCNNTCNLVLINILSVNCRDVVPYDCDFVQYASPGALICDLNNSARLHAAIVLSGGPVRNAVVAL